MSKPRKRLLTFNDPRPLRIDRGLATEIGFLESLVLLQLEYHISTTDNLRDGQYWTYQTLKEMRERDFPWLSCATISRTLKSLEDMGLLNVANYNKSGMDRTQWFALNYAGIAKLVSLAVGEDAPILQNENWELQKEKSILQNAKSMLQDETPILQNAKSILQGETTIPKYSPKTSPKENTKESEVLPSAIGGQDQTDETQTDEKSEEYRAAYRQSRKAMSHPDFKAKHGRPSGPADWAAGAREKMQELRSKS